MVHVRCKGSDHQVVLVLLLPIQGSVKRRYPFPEGSSVLVTPLGNRALASSSESEGMTMTFSPGWDRHRNRGVFSISRLEVWTQS